MTTVLILAGVFLLGSALLKLLAWLQGDDIKIVTLERQCQFLGCDKEGKHEVFKQRFGHVRHFCSLHANYVRRHM